MGLLKRNIPPYDTFLFRSAPRPGSWPASSRRQLTRPSSRSWVDASRWMLSASTGHEVVRLVASLKAGTVAPSAMLRKLAAYERQNQLDLALQELGRIERTLFMLDWLESPEL